MKQQLTGTFHIRSDFEPQGDQPQAIDALARGAVTPETLRDVVDDWL